MLQSTRIGDCEFYLEHDALRLYSHSFGQATGFSTRMSGENVLQLLEWLSQHRDEIAHSLEVEAKEHKILADSMW